MKNLKRTLFFFVALVVNVTLFAQQPYYNNVNLSLTGAALKTELANKITNTHTSLLSYGWSELKITDLDPSNSNNVLLLYGYNDSDGNFTTDRTRNKNVTDNGTATPGLWNREHTFAKSLANPSMSTNSPSAGTDVHHLRACDKQMNSSRGSKKFAAGSGNAGTVGANWYPGDEWKGDVARMMMYMYLRYPTQCVPTSVGTGSTVSLDDMLTLFIDWNAQDPVSTYEEQRNTRLEMSQGNRNPFIDNPYLATVIWGGIDAENTWTGSVSINEKETENSFLIYPVPSNNGTLHVFFDHTEEIKLLNIYNVNGQVIKSISNPVFENNEFIINDLTEGFFVLRAVIGDKVLTKKVVVN